MEGVEDDVSAVLFLEKEESDVWFHAEAKYLYGFWLLYLQSWFLVLG